MRTVISLALVSNYYNARQLKDLKLTCRPAGAASSHRTYSQTAGAMDT